jgi:AcrR family transcriptional regulator
MARLSDTKFGPERILNAAAPLFRQKGFGATSVRDISNAIGVQSSALYYHFSGKQELLFEISRSSVLESLEAVKGIDSHAAPALRLREFVRLHLRSLIKHLDWHGVMLLEHNSLSPENAVTVGELRAQYAAILRDIITDGAEDGSFVVEDIKLATMFMLGSLNWTLIWYRPRGGKSVDEIAEVFANQILASLSPATARSGA